MKKAHIIIAICIIFVIVLSFHNSKKAIDIDWDDAVKTHLSNYNCDFTIESREIDEVNDHVIYHVVTKDSYAIPFIVTCTYGRPTSPVGGQLLFKEERIHNTFYKEVMNYVSDNYGTKDITELTSDESVQYMIDTITLAKTMSESYGILDTSFYGPKIRFELSNNGHNYSLEIGMESLHRFAQILLEKLAKR